MTAELSEGTVLGEPARGVRVSEAGCLGFSGGARGYRLGLGRISAFDLAAGVVRLRRLGELLDGFLDGLPDGLRDGFRGAADRERVRALLGARGLEGSLPFAARSLEGVAPGGVPGARHSAVAGVGLEEAGRDECLKDLPGSSSDGGGLEIVCERRFSRSCR